MMSKPRIKLVIEMPGGHTGFQTIREAREFVQTALTKESELRFASPQWNRSGWHARIKDFRKVQHPRRKPVRWCL